METPRRRRHHLNLSITHEATGGSIYSPIVLGDTPTRPSIPTTFKQMNPSSFSSTTQQANHHLHMMENNYTTLASPPFLNEEREGSGDGEWNLNSLTNQEISEFPVGANMESSFAPTPKVRRMTYNVTHENEVINVDSPHETNELGRNDLNYNCTTSTPPTFINRNNSDIVQEGYYEQRTSPSPTSSLPSVTQEDSSSSQAPGSTSNQETEEEKRRREEEESEALARQLMAEEAMASYQQSTQFLQDHANEYSEEDLQALQAAMAEEGGEGQEEYEGEEGMDSNEMSYETLLQLGERIGDVKKERWALRAKAEIEKLQTMCFDSKTVEGKDENDSSVKCLVCQFAFEDGEKLRILPCGHHFHTECIDQWLSQKHDCPYCRQSIVNDA